MKTLGILLSFLTGMAVYAEQPQISPPTVQKPVYFDISPPLRDMATVNFTPDVSWKDGVVRNHFNVRHHNDQGINSPEIMDPSIQDHFGILPSDTTIQNFEGLTGGSYIPPDTYGDVGLNHYFQVVNASYAIYNKSGVKLLGPLANSSVWNGMPNNTNSGDAVVVYDEIADRWLFSQFSLPNYPNGPFYQMIAISQTPDPTGSWYRYQYTFTSMPDYPKFGVWPDGYYMTCNRFTAGTGFYAGTGAAAFDRTAMLAGDPGAQMVFFTLSSSNEAFGMLPSDCDGEFPPVGTPDYYTYEYDATPYHLGILEFHVDWTNPSSSTFGNLLSLPVNSFNPNIGSGIPQKGTSVRLATLSDRMMYRLQFRQFNDHWSMVTNHSVNAGSNVAGIRWYELRKTSGAWSVYQQATYAPADNNCRWMGSIAMDTAGNIGLGYSISSSNMYPSIRYTGRLSTDPLNTMTIAERGIINGGGCQTSSSQRWGDYSSMTVDPSAPTTFWYTQEYYPTTSSGTWHTRVGSFSFSNIFSSYATADPVSTCGGDSSQLQSVVYGGSGSYTWSWTSDPSGFSSNLSNPKVAPPDTTSYFVTVSDGVHTHHDTTRVLAVPRPTVFAGNDTLVCSNVATIQLQGSATNYKLIGWSSTGDGTFNNKLIFNPTYSFGPHDYSVDSVDLQLIALAINPCTGHATSIKRVTLNPCNGIQSKMEDQKIILEPNPARESVSIVVNGIDMPVLLSLTDMKGQTIFSEKINTGTTSFQKQLDLNNYKPGVYFLKVSTAGKVMVKQLVISN